MNIRRSLMMAAIVSAAGALGSQAHAQCGPYGGYGFGAWDMGRLYGVMADNVPYFAAFPPVYYSAPVPRTYGYSPFAYPPGVMTPDLVETVSEPQVIENPYISPAPTGEGPAMIAPETVDQTTSVAPIRGPQVILNPYVSQTGGASGMASAAGGAAR